MQGRLWPPRAPGSHACLTCGHLPGQPPSLGACVHRQEEPTAALTRRPREGPAKPSLRSGRRLVLRHCGSLRLGSAHFSFLGRAAQVVASFVRGLGPTHSLLGPFRSVIPEGNYPCAFGRFHFSTGQQWLGTRVPQNSGPLAASGAQESVRFSREERSSPFAFQC